MSNYEVVAASDGLPSGIGNRTPGGEEAVTAADSAPSRSVLQAGVIALPWLLALGAATIALLRAGTPAPDIGRYLAYWCLAVTLPGLLVVRATVGTRGNWPEDVALGAVTGLALELGCFALWSILGLQQQLWLWPVLVAAVFLAVPGLRRHWRISAPKPLPRMWSWLVASSMVACVLNVGQTAFTDPLPPSGGVYYPDVTWHLSIVHELTRAFPPQVPQVAGQFLRYHWFSHAHLAAAHLVSGVPVATVVLRLWIFPLLAVTGLIGARLAMELSGRWWTGPVATWTLIVFTGTSLLPVLGESGVIFSTSASQVYVLPLFLGISTLVVRVLRGVRLGAGWAVLALLLLAASGAKPTAMALVLAGTGVAGLWLLIGRRRQWRAALAVGAMVGVILPVSILAVAGSDHSSPIGLFDFVQWSQLYHSLTGAGFHPASGAILPEGVSDLSGRSLAILAILLLVPLVANLARLAPFAWLGSRRLHTDPASWFMVGVVMAGWLVYLTLSHPGDSQAYFVRLANPVASVFGAWVLGAAVPFRVRRGRAVVAVLACGTLIGAGVVALGRALTPSLAENTHDLAAVVTSFVVPLTVLLVAIAVGLLGWQLMRRKAPGLRGWGSALALAAVVIGAPAEGAVNSTLDPIADLAVKPVSSSAPTFLHVSRFRLGHDSAAAMAWLDRHTPNSAVVATNSHCINKPSQPGCLSLAFWVSGLGGRRTVLESWGYTSEAKTATSPTPFPERLAVNDAAFTDPTAKTIDRLRERYGASWLVANTSAGHVSPELSRFAVPRFHSGSVTIYQVR